jgi:hypothetical protein
MSLRTPLRAFWDFWTKPIRAESLAMFRILLGLTFLGNLLTGIGPSLKLTCGQDGVCPAEACDKWLAQTGRMCLLRGPVSLPILSDWLPESLARAYPWLNEQLPADWAEDWAEWGATPEAAYLLLALLLASLVCMTVGLGTRISTLAAVLLASTFHHRLAWLMNGGDFLIRNGLYFLLFSPAGAVWSVDNILRRRLWGRPVASPVLIAPWSVRLMQIQVCTMYFFTGVVKLAPDYLNGEALYWVLNDIALCRWPYARVPIPLLLCRMLSWTTLLFEVGFSFLVCIRPVRKYVLMAGLAFHLGIFVVMEIGWFSQVAMCWYVLFVPGEKVAEFVGRVAPRRSSAASAMQTSPGIATPGTRA